VLSPQIRSRTEADDELRTFTLARIKTVIFDQVRAEIGVHFPASRKA